MEKKFYVTTPIYYVNAKPHLGSLYSTILADVATRWHKIKGYQTFFMTGTDEHGQKVYEASVKNKLDPQDFVDSFVPVYKDIWMRYGLEYDVFARTTSKNHVKAVQNWIRKLKKQNDIYKSTYSGFYCTPCETFITEKDFTKNNIVKCTTCERETNFISEECYFFKLSSYQDKLLKFYEENPNFVTPKERLNEVISFVKSGLKDLSISRTTVKWGIPFPDDDKHVTYVWADALNIYITAVGFGDESKEKDFQKWWPADMQIMGKDIIRFHAVYWPAFLMASGLKLPKNLLVHGWIKVNNQKMSKSLGNAVDPENLLKSYEPDEIRYYLIKQMAITQDSEFSYQDLDQKINSDLVNDLGNLLNRTLTLAHKNGLNNVNPPEKWSECELSLRDSFWTMLEEFETEMDEGFYYKALAILWKFVNQVNSYFHNKEPWKLAKLNSNDFSETISATLHSIYSIAILIWPVMPNKSAQILDLLSAQVNYNSDLIEQLASNPWNKTFNLKLSADTLFKKREILPEVKPMVTEQQVENIKIDDFLKIKLAVGEIITCEALEKSEKLLKLNVDFGKFGKRQILSGIKQSYSPEQLINKKAVFILNLEPRKLMGYESCGMILTTAKNENLIEIIQISSEIENGTILK